MMRRSHGSLLRVLFIGIKWPPETFLARLVRSLAEREILVTLAAPRETGGWESIPNVEIMVIEGWGGSHVGRLWRAGGRFTRAALRSLPDTHQTYAAARSGETNARPFEQIYRSLPFAGRDWDVIYFPWNTAAIAYYPLMDKAPSVISCRGAQINIAPHNPKRREQFEGLRSTFEKAAAVHCVSAAIRDEAALYGLDKSKAVVIRPAIDPKIFYPAGVGRRASPGSFRVVSTGSIIWRKGYEYALVAVRKLIDQGVPVCYEIIGDGDETQRLLYTIHDLELTDHVIWHGRLSPAQVLARLREADVFLLSSLSEGISNAVLEGMACGLPVVTTHVGGMAEAVTNGVEGFLVPARDPVALADGLLQLWRRPELRERMGTAARDRVMRDFQIDDQADAFVELFRSVASS